MKKNKNIFKKKRYNQPILTQIGKVHDITKAKPGGLYDSLAPASGQEIS